MSDIHSGINDLTNMNFGIQNIGDQQNRERNFEKLLMSNVILILYQMEQRLEVDGGDFVVHLGVGEAVTNEIRKWTGVVNLA